MQSEKYRGGILSGGHEHGEKVKSENLWYLAAETKAFSIFHWRDPKVTLESPT